jgi:branched-chain amino acid transport system ATP-binding protein
MLELRNVHAFYGKSHVLHGVNCHVGTGEIVALLGRNGSGRSTTVKTIMGLVEGTGHIGFKGEALLGRPAFEVAHRGIGYVPENRDIFPTITVHQNLQLGQKKAGKNGRWSFEDMYKMFPRLLERQNTEAGVLSGGEQQTSPPKVWRPRSWSWWPSTCASSSDVASACSWLNKSSPSRWRWPTAAW